MVQAGTAIATGTLTASTLASTPVPTSTRVTPEPISHRPSRVAANRACTHAPVVHASVATVMATPVSVGLACRTLWTVKGR